MLCECGEAERVPYRNRPGRFYKRCLKCENNYRKQLPNRKTIRDRDSAKQRASRKLKEEVDRWICVESRSSDRKRGRANDMTRPLIKELIKDGCLYCGETTLRMTLDRIDNTKGHIKTNVVPACVRCNLLRRDMPYAAWLLLAPAVRQVREQGVFGTWIPGPHNASMHARQ
jgi:hypothetical protein